MRNLTQAHGGHPGERGGNEGQGPDPVGLEVVNPLDTGLGLAFNLGGRPRRLGTPFGDLRTSWLPTQPYCTPE